MSANGGQAVSVGVRTACLVAQLSGDSIPPGQQLIEQWTLRRGDFLPERDQLRTPRFPIQRIPVSVLPAATEDLAPVGIGRICIGSLPAPRQLTEPAIVKDRQGKPCVG